VIANQRDSVFDAEFHARVTNTWLVTRGNEFAQDRRSIRKALPQVRKQADGMSLTVDASTGTALKEWIRKRLFHHHRLRKSR